MIQSQNLQDGEQKPGTVVEQKKNAVLGWGEKDSNSETKWSKTVDQMK